MMHADRNTISLLNSDETIALASKLLRAIQGHGTALGIGVYKLGHRSIISNEEHMIYSNVWLENNEVKYLVVRIYWKSGIYDFIQGNEKLLQDDLTRMGF